MTSHSADPTKPNTLVQKPVLDTVEGLLQDNELLHSGLSDYEQGQVITDRFIGTVFAQGDVVGSKETFSPDQTLSRINTAMKVPGTKDEKLKHVTSSAGLRDAVDMLASDARTGQHLLTIHQRVTQFDGGLAMMSINQVDGYLAAKHTPGLEDSTNWRESLRESVLEYMKGTPGRWETRDLASRDAAELGRQEQLEWERASQYAQSAGVDMDLLQRSAEVMRQMSETGRYVGNTAISGAFSDYGKLVRGE